MLLRGARAPSFESRVRCARNIGGENGAYSAPGWGKNHHALMETGVLNGNGEVAVRKGNV